ncbi:synapse-associated protein 1-like isoform X2 [Panonychus citri]|uniref:synapse-associated protein 1-like isoform X2 n=1 Tax=Panonychus citri TaxID=50023 RepID=UPI002307EC5B|nr:synapse-associated protein 1-like isoform X2 [Panonychus citri]
MDFVSNILKKTPFKSESSEDREKPPEEENQSEPEKKQDDSASASSPGGDDATGDKLTLSEQVSSKAMDSAKSIGNFLFNVANKAGQTVTATATKLKQTVEHNSLLADFTKEQQEFIKEHGGNIEVGEPPWIGCEQEEEVKTQIISLSQDKRNFVRSPPSGVQFDFDMQQMLPVTLAILKHDPNLEKMRFDLVPKLVNEETFWRNYFYRVSLIKQSTSLSNMNKGCKGWASSSSSSAEGPDEPSPTNPEPEFISDSIQGSVSEEDLKSGMRQLGVGRGSVSKDRTDSTSAQDDN